MLAKFSVSNFKSFDSKLTFDLHSPNGYAFNKESIKNNIVNNAIIYGKNGIGKSNLGLAIFDIVGHLTDKQMSEPQYSFYLNAANGSGMADFYYEFIFGSDKVSYYYKKSSNQTVVSEQFLINDKVLAYIDRTSSDEAIINFKGAESLKRNISNQNLSLLKYIRNNSELDKNEENSCFKKFFEFIEAMLFFSSLEKNIYLGLQSGSRGIAEDIINNGNVPDLERFLNIAGVDCKLAVVKESEKEVLAFDFNGKTISFYSIASRGTKALIVFYYWLQRIRAKSKVSLVFIDEFDAFYHHELSTLIVDELKKSGVQMILTTHNTSILSNDLLRPDCYFLMTKDAVKSLPNCTLKELREAHNLEKLYKAHTFNG